MVGRHIFNCLTGKKNHEISYLFTGLYFINQKSMGVCLKVNCKDMGDVYSFPSVLS